jgi:hypothetical protein
VIVVLWRGAAGHVLCERGDGMVTIASGDARHLHVNCVNADLDTFNAIQPFLRDMAQTFGMTVAEPAGDRAAALTLISRSTAVLVLMSTGYLAATRPTDDEWGAIAELVARETRRGALAARVYILVLDEVVWTDTFVARLRHQVLQGGTAVSKAANRHAAMVGAVQDLRGKLRLQFEADLAMDVRPGPTSGGVQPIARPPVASSPVDPEPAAPTPTPWPETPVVPPLATGLARYQSMTVQHSPGPTSTLQPGDVSATVPPTMTPGVGHSDIAGAVEKVGAIGGRWNMGPVWLLDALGRSRDGRVALPVIGERFSQEKLDALDRTLRSAASNGNWPDSFSYDPDAQVISTNHRDVLEHLRGRSVAQLATSCGKIPLRNRHTVFICYGRGAADPYMTAVSRAFVPAGMYRIDAWHDGRLETGIDWHKRILEALREASAAILIVDTNFLNSDYIGRYELPAIVRRHRDESMPIYPVLASACCHQALFGDFQFFRRSGAQGQLRDEAFDMIADGIRNQIYADLVTAVNRDLRQYTLPVDG